MGKKVKQMQPGIEEITQVLRDTLAFFALFERPLQEEELLQFLYVHEKFREDRAWYASRGAKSVLLDVVSTNKQFKEKNGWWYLSDATYSMEPEEFQGRAQKYWKRVDRYMPLLRFIPFIRNVSVGNTLAFDTIKPKGSDIDLLIITAKGHIWEARLWTTILLQLLGVRRHGNKTQRRFCLSFYVAEDALDFTPILKGEDIYMQFWLATLVPLWGEDAYVKLCRENRHLLEAFPRLSAKSMRFRKEVGRVQKLKESLSFRWASNLAKWLQAKKMQHLPVAQTKESSIVVSDKMLKFHNKDRREEFRDRWNKLRNPDS